MSYELLVFSGEANPKLTHNICQYLHADLGSLTFKRFSDGEMFVKINENVRGRDVFVIQPLSYPTNDHLMQLLLLIDTLRRASAARITIVIPYYGYARQDRKNEPRVPISARVVADILESMLPDRLISMDLHADQIQGFFHIPVDHLYAAPVFIDYIKNKYPSDTVVVSPDTGGVERARFFARHLNANLAIVDKRRSEANVSEVMHIIGDVEAKQCILYDDIIDTAGTITQAAQALKDKGAKQVLACATHAVLSGNAIERIHESALSEVIVSDTIQLTLEKQHPKIQVLSVAHIVGEAIRRIHNEESVSSLFV